MAISPARVDELRSRIPLTERWAYLNNAAVAPLPLWAVEAAGEVARRTAATAERGWEDRNLMIEGVRELAARLLGGVDPRSVALLPNTSTGLSLVAQGIDWRPGDSVVGAECEFPSNVYPWMLLADRGVEHRRAPEREGRVDLDELLSLVDERTRVVALSWVQFSSGHRSDLARLGRFCRSRDLLLVVDAIQGLGALALDPVAEEVDVVACGGHKWLLGPEGTGIGWFGERAIERVAPTLAGWRSTGTDDWTRFDPVPRPGARRFEPGNHNAMGIAALGASIEVLLELGPEAVEERVVGLARRAARGLVEAGCTLLGDDPPRSGIVAVTLPGREAAEVSRALFDEQIVVTHRAGRLRVSPHVYSTEAEIDRLVEAVTRLGG